MSTKDWPGLGFRALAFLGRHILEERRNLFLGRVKANQGLESGIRCSLGWPSSINTT